MLFFETLGRSLWTMRQFHGARRGPKWVRVRQERRLRELLEFAVARSPFYRERFKSFDPKRCSLTDLPPTNKGELMANFDRVVTDPDVHRSDLEHFVEDSANIGRLFRDKYAICHTSGSQGQPFLIVQDPLVLDLFFAFQMTRGNTTYRYGPVETVRRLFSPARLAVIISRNGFFPSAWIWQHLPPIMRAYVRFLYLQGNDPELIEKLNAFQPTALTSTPTTLDLLTQKTDRLRLTKLRQIVANSETLTDAARARIATAFGVPVMDNYACGECVFLSNGCKTHSGAHINEDWVILEVVDEANQPVPPGQLGHKVLLTNLANRVQPLIRYEVGDRLTMATEPCGCGNRLPRVDRVLGRAAEFFWVRASDGYRPLTAYPFQHAFDYLREVREWQATQRERNRLLVRFELLPGATLDLMRARSRLNERLNLAGFNGELDIELEIVPHLVPDQSTGKFRRLVNLVGRPDDLAQPS